MLRFVVARVVPLLALLVLVPAASASLIEEITGAVYQEDAFRPGDASDVCEQARPLAWPGRYEGLVVAQDDVLDFYLIDVAPTQVGKEIAMTLEAWSDLHPDDAAVELRPDLDLYVYERGCGTYLSSSRTYNGTETLSFVPERPGSYVVLVLLYAPVADVPVRAGIPAPVEQLGYDLRLA